MARPLPRRRFALVSLLAAALAPACAPLRRASVPTGTGLWSGRLSLVLQTVPAQSFSAGFELRGNAEQGELDLTTPLGTTLARARWRPGLALLQSGQDRREFGSMEALLQDLTGAALPLAALFEWLAGRDTAVAGWQADLTRLGEGRLQARRLAPGPGLDLRLVLEP